MRNSNGGDKKTNILRQLSREAGHIKKTCTGEMLEHELKETLEANQKARADVMLTPVLGRKAAPLHDHYRTHKANICSEEFQVQADGSLMHYTASGSQEDSWRSER